ncbi:MAG: YidC/Oxa1 family membrane protein insertase [Candidatus Azambacteria bacterium]|nr:YidC/Oxa1 family membrane protein insertase [Candidatus Azambacteria bacterium]
MISSLFNEIFYQPLFNGLIFLYNIVPGRDMGVSIIILTALIRLVLWPLTNKSIRNQKVLTKIQPQIEETKKRLKNNKEEQAKALMKIYADNKINPLAGFLPLLIQIPIIIALWQVFLNSVNLDLNSLYSFIPAPDKIQPIFLGLVDLSQRSVVLAILAGGLQYFQTRMIMPATTKSDGTSDFGQIMAKQMLYMGPVLSVIIFWSLPAALPLYWVVVTLLTILQQYIHQNDRGEINTT